MKRDQRTRFWEKIHRTNNCCNWTAFKAHGYGRFDGMRAHRFAWEITYGAIPNGAFILHKCDNPSCVKPTHLFLGTQKDNMNDMILKGRGAGHRGYIRRNK